MKPMNRTLLLAALLLALVTTPAWADGTLTHLSGSVSVQKTDGKILPGAIGTKVGAGDTVLTGAGGYARVEMTDGGEMVLRPDSQLQVESYKFTEGKPAEDSFVFSMLKGGLRTVTGLIGKRGNRDAYKLNTQTATIGIRGTQFDLRVCQANCGALADGTYLAVRFGAVQTTNAQGTLAVAAGQVAHVPPQRAPVMLPRDPGIGFTPPAVIPKLDEKKKQQSAPAASQTQGSTTTAAAKPAAGAPAAEQKQEEKKDAKQETKQDSKQETKQDAKQETKQEAKQDTKQEAKQDNKPQSQAQSQSPAQSQSQSQSQTQSQSQSQTQTQSQPQTEASAPASTSGAGSTSASGSGSAPATAATSSSSAPAVASTPSSTATAPASTIATAPAAAPIQIQIQTQTSINFQSASSGGGQNCSVE